jgi:ornithine carbamoyltransferase
MSFDFLALADFGRDELLALLDAADALQAGHRSPAGALAGRTVLTLFPEASVRTRVTFEAAVQRMGATHVSLPPTALDGREPLADLAGYLGCWIDLLIARHPSLALLRELATALEPPLINAMTRENHPCEILADVQALRRRRGDPAALRYALLAPAGNIAHSWCAAARVLGLHVVQACPPSYAVAPGCAAPSPVAVPSMSWPMPPRPCAARTWCSPIAGPPRQRRAPLITIRCCGRPSYPTRPRSNCWPWPPRGHC